jgi:hypothetical protein
MSQFIPSNANTEGPSDLYIPPPGRRPLTSEQPAQPSVQPLNLSADESASHDVKKPASSSAASGAPSAPSQSRRTNRAESRTQLASRPAHSSRSRIEGPDGAMLASQSSEGVPDDTRPASTGHSSSSPASSSSRSSARANPPPVAEPRAISSSQSPAQSQESLKDGSEGESAEQKVSQVSQERKSQPAMRKQEQENVSGYLKMRPSKSRSRKQMSTASNASADSTAAPHGKGSNPAHDGAQGDVSEVWRKSRTWGVAATSSSSDRQPDSLSNVAESVLSAPFRRSLDSNDLEDSSDAVPNGGGEGKVMLPSDILSENVSKSDSSTDSEEVITAVPPSATSSSKSLTQQQAGSGKVNSGRGKGDSSEELDGIEGQEVPVGVFGPR